jgi:hypothetical protein
MGNFSRCKILNFTRAQFYWVNKSLFIFGQHYRFYSTVENLIPFISIFCTRFYAFFRPDMCRNYVLNISLSYLIPALVGIAAVMACSWFLSVCKPIGVLVLERDVTVPFTVHFFGRDNPHLLQWARASSFMRYLDHTQRHITVGRTPLDE